MRHLITAICVLIAAPIAGAQDASQAAKEATAKLEAILRPRLYKLNRDLITFHYEAPMPGWIPQTVPELQGHILNWGERFFDPSVTDESDMQGPGVYVAIDPAASRDVGGWEDPQLYVITLKKGSTILDLAIDVKEAEILALKEVAQKTNCIGTTSYSDFNDIGRLTPFFRNSTDACRKILIDAYANLGVQGISYNYMAAGSLKGCRFDRNEAISVLDSKSIKAEDLTLISKSSGVVGLPIQGLVRSLYAESSGDFSMQNSEIDHLDRFLAPPGGLDSVSAAPNNRYEQWKAQHIFKCGARWPTEEADPRKFKIKEIYQNSIADNEIRAIEIKVKIAYAQKFKQMNFQVDRLNQFEQQQYLAAGMLADMSKFKNWTKAKDTFFSWDDDPNEKFRKIEALLDESQYHPNPFANIALADSIVNSVDLKNPHQPGLIFKSLKMSGYGPRLTVLEGDLVLAYQGAVPIVTAEAAADFDKKNPSTTSANREKFKQMLTTCLAVYQDPDSQPDDIQNGPCGMHTWGN